MARLRKHMKYIMLDHPSVGDCPILFPVIFAHRDIAASLIDKEKLVSAGFVYLDDNKVVAHDGSDSLGLKARPQDAEIIQRFLLK